MAGEAVPEKLEAAEDAETALAPVETAVVLDSNAASDASHIGKSAQRIALKRAKVSEIVFERLSSSTQRLMDSLESVPLTTAKDVQAAATALGILDDHFGGRQQSTGSRFGEAEAFDGEVTETAERITRRYRSRGRS